MKIPKKYLHKSGKLNQKLLQCNGKFFKRDPHPTVSCIVFNHYNHQRKAQFWTTSEKLKPIQKCAVPTSIPQKFLKARNTLNQDALQVSGEFTMRDPHPKVKGVVFLAKSVKGKQRWGWADKVSSKPKRKAPDGIPSKFIHQKGASKDKLNQKVLQVGGRFKKRNPHPKCPLIVFEGCKGNKQRWITLEKSLERLNAGRRCNMTADQIEKAKEISRKSRTKHCVKIRARVAKWQKQNPKKRKEQTKRRYERVKDDKDFKIKRGLRNALRNIKRGYKSDSTEKLLGISIDACCSYIEAQFTAGMTWDNMGKGGWHIDHIIPCAFFDLTNPSHQKVCFNYKNLQPLWESDNCRKGDKIHWSIVLTLMMNNYKTIGLN
jgi:hypothetical protein